MEQNTKMNTTEPDIFGIYHHTKDGVMYFRCRGVGKAYAEFYEWTRRSSYICDDMDWPWDYFHFLDEADAQEVLRRFEPYCCPDFTD